MLVFWSASASLAIVGYQDIEAFREVPVQPHGKGPDGNVEDDNAHQEIESHAEIKHKGHQAGQGNDLHKIHNKTRLWCDRTRYRQNKLQSGQIRTHLVI